MQSVHPWQPIGLEHCRALSCTAQQGLSEGGRGSIATTPQGGFECPHTLADMHATPRTAQAFRPPQG